MSSNKLNTMMSMDFYRCEFATYVYTVSKGGYRGGAMRAIAPRSQKIGVKWVEKIG